MSSLLNTLERPVSPVRTAPILVQGGFSCTLLTLEPGASTPELIPATPDQLLFVIDGGIIVHGDGVSTVVNRDQAFLLGRGQPHHLSSTGDQPARVLRVEIPPRLVVAPALIEPQPHA